MAKDSVASVTLIVIATSFIVIVSLSISLPDSLTKKVVTPPPYFRVIPEPVDPQGRKIVSLPPSPYTAPRQHQSDTTTASKKVHKDLQTPQIFPPPPPPSEYCSASPMPSYEKSISPPPSQ